MLVFFGLVLAAAEYVGKVLLERCMLPLGGFALLEGAGLAFWRLMTALFSI